MDKDQIKQTYSMRDIVEQYGFRPNRAGFIKCPFHSGDKTASMKIYAHDAHCFGCNWNGDIFSFVQDMDNLTFKEAFQALGGTYNCEDKKAVKRKIELAKRKRIERAERESELKMQKNMLNRYIEGLRNGIDYFAPFSDEWCFCQNELPKQLYLYDILNGLEENA